MGSFEIVVGLVDIFQIEARALLEGLKFAWAKGYRRVEIENENDNSISVAIIQNGLTTNNICSEVGLIQDWCCKDWEEKFQQIMRESDMVIDRVAKEALGEMDHLIIHEEPPKSVRGLLDDDTHCATYPLFDGD
ncbi:hypothetical protein Goklo_028732 [Gossypium klotzschianum]|uniref:RNase H type-1 domain-containing protein n=1 Tax=Gossypium klotzschianum TaxID=34286 RepID=A0A7J8U2G9_9ROSI|nr:hypothetical protein [Gossypium klotzschianum]